VLDDISFSPAGADGRPGRPFGSGKSTLANLIPRFYHHDRARSCSMAWKSRIRLRNLRAMFRR
jgi:hypothetical protein